MKETTIIKKFDFLIFTAFILISFFLFYYQKPFTNAIFVILCLGIFYFYFRKALIEKDERSNSKLLIYISIAFIALKFYKIFSFPADFFGDEWTDIMSAHGILKGDAGLFDYNPKNGVALPYVNNWITALAMKIITYHLDLLRFIPVLIFTATAYGFWKLGKQINMLEPASFIFVYTLSEWAWKSSKLYLSNIYVPLFVVFFLILFLSAVKNGSTLKLIATGLIFTIGFFTYGTWILLTPFVIYLAIEYRKELGKSKLIGFISFIVFSTLAAVFIYLSNPHLANAMAERTIFASNKGILGIVLTGFLNIYKFFFATIDTDKSFMSLPFFYAIELILLIIGVTKISVNIRNREDRVILIGFILSLATIVFTPEIIHPMRHVILFTFATIVCGKGLEIVSTRKKFMFLLIPVYVFFALSFMFVYYFVWPSYMPQTMIDRKIASYINKNYVNSNVLYIPDTEPFGRNMAYLRTKTAYEKNNIQYDSVIFTTPVLWHHALMSVLPDIHVKYFFDSNQSVALWSLNIEKHPETIPFFMEISKNLSEVDDLMWKQDYDKALEKISSKIEMDKNMFSILQNTFLKVHECNAYNMKGKIKMLVDCLINNKYPSLVIPDDFYIAGDIFDENELYDKAYDCYKRAFQLAPEWTNASVKMNLIRKKILK